MEIKAKEIKFVPLQEIKRHPKNPNKHPKEQIERIVKVIKKQGFRRPLTISNRSGLLIVGHGRLEAAKQLGFTELPVTYQDYESERDEYLDMVADNAIADGAELDLEEIKLEIKSLGLDDVGVLGIKDFEIEDDKFADKDADAVPEVTDSYVKLGDIYQLGEHRLMCGDSTNREYVEKLMGGDKAELCFTSPPYADQREYNGGKELGTEHLAKFISAAKDNVNYFAVNLGYSRKNLNVNPYWDDYIKESEKCNLNLLSWNVWNKGECGSIGNQTAMFGISHEWIFVFGEKPKELNRTIENKNGGDWNNHSSIRNKDGSVSKGKNRFVHTHSQLKTIYDCVPQKARDDIDHPARFPVDFPLGYIEAMTKRDEIVYEPFCGSGSTLIAAEKTGRKCYAMELDPHYCAVIIKRWEDFTGKKANKLT